MRVTSSMYYDNLYSKNNTNLQNKLFDVNKQIASGLSIQYASDDVATFTETMRLDNEITTLGQIKDSTQNGYKVSNQTDVTLNEFEDSLNRVSVLLLSAANGTNDDTSLDAIANELRGIEKHFKTLANTSINGKYLFSGSSTDIRPISDDGIYMGNDSSIDSFTGSRTTQQYNISGAELFLSDLGSVNREVTSNVVNKNLISQYPAIQGATDIGSSNELTSSNTIRDLMGDTDNSAIPSNEHFFYLRGTQSDGTTFAQKIPAEPNPGMQDGDSIQNLLTQIGSAYGNTSYIDVVNVSMNSDGQIVVEDKISGSSKLDFHMVGAVDFSGGAAADVTNIDDLGTGENDFKKIMLGVSTATNPDLHIKEFMKSSLSSSESVATTNIIEGTVYDRTQFTKDGGSLFASIPQVLKHGNSFATGSTKLSEVADISKGTVSNIDPTVDPTADDTLSGAKLILSGDDVNGTPYYAEINLATSGSTFSVDSDGDGSVDTNYDIFNMQDPRVAVDADEMTYQQLMDVTNMIVTNSLPATSNTLGDDIQESKDYDLAIRTSNFNASTSLTYDGKIQFTENSSSDTKATISLHDSNSGNFSLSIDSDGDGVIDKAASPVMTFNSNNGLTVRDPKTDFFKTIDEVITAVENYKTHPDSTSGDIRNAGILNGVKMIEDLQDHIFGKHSIVGAQSNALSNSLERTELLEISTMTLRSSVIDTDLAEASLALTQLTLNYEAMLSTVGRVSKLSLVNYL